MKIKEITDIVVHMYRHCMWGDDCEDVGWDWAELDVIAWMPLPEPYKEQTERSK